MRNRLNRAGLGVFTKIGYVLLSSLVLALSAWTFSTPVFIKLLVAGLSALYALLGLGALIGLIHPAPFHCSESSPFSSKRSQRIIRGALLLVPVPFVVSMLVLHSAKAPGLAGEMLESSGSYIGAKHSYQLMSEIHKLYKSRDVMVTIQDEATLGRICDRLHQFNEADHHYFLAEKLAKKHLHQFVVTGGNKQAEPLPNNSKLIATPRLLRLLTSIPEKTALHEFDYAAAVLKGKNATALKMGRQFIAIDLRPLIRDYRPAPPLDESIMVQIADGIPSDCAGSGMREVPGPQGSFATPVTAVRQTGEGFTAIKLRSLLKKIPRDKAMAEFDFAKDYYPGVQTKNLREHYQKEATPGAYLEPVSVRYLIPSNYVIVPNGSYKRLVDMAEY